MAQLFRAVAAFAQGTGTVPNTHVAAHNICNYRSKKFHNFLWHPQNTRHTYVYIHTCSQISIPIFFKYLKKYSDEHILNTNDHRVLRQS